ncbi:MAG: transposase [Leptospiraceae bacterium]|nr:transposase [Leptospiraceae bacterium]
MTTSPWDKKEMNEIRINFMREHSDSYPTKKAILVIDDSGVVKRGSSTEGAGYQYIGQVGKVANGNVFVTSHLVSEFKHLPLDIKAFIPEDKTKTKEEQEFATKIEIAIFLIEEAIRRGIEFEFVVADAWYGSSPNFTDYLEAKGLKYIVSIKSNRNIFYKFPNDLKSSEHKISELVTYRTTLGSEMSKPVNKSITYI